MTYPAPKISRTLALVFYALALPCSLLEPLLFADEEFLPGLLLILPLMIAACVFTSILHYRCWAAIPADQRRTTPGKAVGFLFIPLFNFYWMFVSYPGLATDIAKATRTKSATTLGVMYAILSICCWIPILGVFAQIPAFVVWILYTRQVVHQANMLLAYDHARTVGVRNVPPVIELP